MFINNINTDAEALSSQLVEALAVIIQPEHQQNASRSLHKLFVEVIQECLKLKIQAALSGVFYELYPLSSGTKYDPKRMKLAPGSSSKKGRTLFCLLPSVIKYKTKRFKDTTILAQDIGSLGDFIERKEGQRTDGTVLFPALVTLQ